MPNSLMKMKLEQIVNTAQRMSQNSPEERKKVGVVIFDKNLDILSTGWNAKPVHSKNFHVCVDTATDMSCHDLIHGEVRAILNAGRTLCKGNYMFVTDAPCCRCAGPIAEVDFEHVFYVNDHDNGIGPKLLRDDYGVNVTRLKSFEDLHGIITRIKNIN